MGYGNGKIHPYPLERLLIFTEECFESLQKELVRFKINESKPKKVTVKQAPKLEYRPLPQRITHDYEPSNIWPAYDGARQRWRRMNEWFSRLTQDDRQNRTLENVLKNLQT